MNYLEAVILGLIQAATEYLPVSSSGHLALAEISFGLHGDGILTFDIILHFATLLVTVVYLKDDILEVVCKLFNRSSDGTRARKLLILLVIGSLPAAMVGLLLKDYIEDAFGSLRLLGMGFFLTSVFLLMARQKGLKQAGIKRILDSELALPTVRQSLIVGASQALAILPGVSRSGTTISTGLLVGLDISTSLRFSFLLSLPIIFGATLLEVISVDLDNTFKLDIFALGFISAFIGVGLRFVCLYLSRQHKITSVCCLYSNFRWFMLSCQFSMVKRVMIRYS